MCDHVNWMFLADALGIILMVKNAPHQSCPVGVEFVGQAFHDRFPISGVFRQSFPRDSFPTTANMSALIQIRRRLRSRAASVNDLSKVDDEFVKILAISKNHFFCHFYFLLRENSLTSFQDQFQPLPRLRGQ
jgi:hypothetical protein